jgi:hypothetical protein
MMRKFLFGLWIFTMGAVLSFSCKALYGAIYYNREMAQTNLLIAAVLGGLATIPVIAVIHSYRRDIDGLHAMGNGRLAGCQPGSPGGGDRGPVQAPVQGTAPGGTVLPPQADGSRPQRTAVH